MNTSSRLRIVLRSMLCLAVLHSGTLMGAGTAGDGDIGSAPIAGAGIGRTGAHFVLLYRGIPIAGHKRPREIPGSVIAAQALAAPIAGAGIGHTGAHFVRMASGIRDCITSIASHEMTNSLDPWDPLATTLSVPSGSIETVLADEALCPTYLALSPPDAAHPLGQVQGVPPAGTPSHRDIRAIKNVIVSPMDLAHIPPLLRLMDTFPRATFDVVGYEGFAQFLRGRLEYRPNPGSDKGLVVLPFRDILRPREGRDSPFPATFDLSRCDNAGKYLSINIGYKKAINPANANKTEVWICPKFLVERERPATLAPIMGQWEAPVGYFWTWGGNDVKADNYDYLLNGLAMENDKNFHLKREESKCRLPYGVRRRTLACRGMDTLNMSLLRKCRIFL
jgi:hypothetical protein